jgi:hypothetical protein
MTGTKKTNSIEGVETSNHGFVRTGRQHAATPRGLVLETSHKAEMVSGCESTVILAPNKQKMDKAPSTKHWTTAIRHPRHRRIRATQTRTNACRHSDPTATVYRDQRTYTHSHTSYNTDHTTGSVRVGHMRSVPRLAKTHA